MWYAGIDWADAHHDALVIDDAGRQVGSLRVNHTPEGLKQLHAFLEHITGPGGREQMACIVETSRGLLIASLLEAGWPVYPVHPKTVDRRRAASGAKTDAIDAYLWDELREKHLHNRAFTSLDEVIEVLCQGLNALADDPAALRSLTGFPHIINVEF
jgi:transposase